MAKKAVKVGICQFKVKPFDVKANLAKIERFISRAARQGAQICVLPEFADVGFDGNARMIPGAAQPVPGKTTKALGMIAAQHKVWIATAVLEKMPGGCFDTSVLINSNGELVHKQRKGYVYPKFGGLESFQGNYLDTQVIDSPWGPIGIINCADMTARGKRLYMASLKPSLVLASIANPGAVIPAVGRELARECGCPVAGVNLVFENTNREHRGGKGAAFNAKGEWLWEGRRGVDLLKVIRLVPARPKARVGLLEFPEVGAHQGAELDRGLVGHWRLDGNAKDASRNGNDGIIHGRPRFWRDLPTKAVKGNFSFWFDGKTNYVEIPNSSSVNAPEVVTCALWYKSTSKIPFFPDNKGSNVVLLNKGRNGRTWDYHVSGSNYIIGFHRDFYIFAGGTRFIWAASLDSKPRRTGKWQHIAAVIDGKNKQVKLYLDGVLEQTVRGAPSRWPTNDDPLFIGARSEKGQRFQGKVCDVRIYRRALSDREIAKLVPGSKPRTKPRITLKSKTRGEAGAAISIDGRFVPGRGPRMQKAMIWTEWRKVRGPGEVVFTSRHSPKTKVTCAKAGKYVFELSGSDGWGVARKLIKVEVRK